MVRYANRVATKFQPLQDQNTVLSNPSYLVADMRLKDHYVLAHGRVVTNSRPRVPDRSLELSCPMSTFS